MSECLILVVADDFTGACDTGLQFRTAGLDTVALIEPEASAIDEVRASAVVIDTESRQLPRLPAAERVGEMCRRAKALEPDLVYKKVDSALRGNLASEVFATMDAFGLELCIMAPALPASGRVTVGGYHLVHGVPVDRTEVGHDPGSPVRGSYLPHLLDAEASLRVKTIGLEDVALGSDHVHAMVEGLRGAGPSIIVIDAASESDLRAVAEAAAAIAPRPLLCGSAGLAAHLPAAFGLSEREAPPVSTPSAGPSLLVIGTTESTTREQVSRLRETRSLPEWEVHVDATAFGWERPHLLNVVEAIAERLAVGDAILTLVGLHEGMFREDAERAMAAIGECVRRVFSRVQPAALVVSGGWTAVTALSALGASGADIVGAVEGAVPVCRLRGGEFDGLPTITKGGALGSLDVFVRALDPFRRPVQASRTNPGSPVLALTMGDPCGVGPEIIAKAFGRPELYEAGRPFVIGDAEILRAAAGLVGSQLTIRPVRGPGACEFRAGTVDVLEPVKLDRSQVRTGEVCPEAGRVAAEWVIAAVQMALDKEIDAIVTAPLNKEAMNLAGFSYAGHTELLAERSRSKGARLMLASDRLCVSHVTGHVALADVPSLLTEERVYETIALMRDALLRLKGYEPRIAVCGLNPHAGENGLFGNEDATVVAPAVAAACAAGWDIDGPLPADTTFFKVYDGLYDGVVAMYHDQGHVPAKLVAFADAVNVTLGLPIIRTSVDHGTAFDIAGTGTAKEGNLLHAARLAGRLAGQGARS